MPVGLGFHTQLGMVETNAALWRNRSFCVLRVFGADRRALLRMGAACAQVPFRSATWSGLHQPKLTLMCNSGYGTPLTFAGETLALLRTKPMALLAITICFSGAEFSFWTVPDEQRASVVI